MVVMSRKMTNQEHQVSRCNIPGQKSHTQLKRPWLKMFIYHPLLLNWRIWALRLVNVISLLLYRFCLTTMAFIDSPSRKNGGNLSDHTIIMDSVHEIKEDPIQKVSLLYSHCMFSFRKIPGNSQDSAR